MTADLTWGRITLKAEPRSTIDLLSEIYVRLDCDATMFGQDAPYLQVSVGQNPNNGLNPLPEVFGSFEEARLYLDALTAAVYCAKGELSRLSEAELKLKRDVSALDENQISCLVQAGLRLVDLDQNPVLRDHLHALERSATAWSLALRSMSIGQGHERCQIRLLLEIQVFVPWHCMKTWCDKTEEAGDRLQDQYVHVLDLIEQYLGAIFISNNVAESRSDRALRSFALSHSVLLPLFLIASKCRDSAVRRRALSIPAKLHLQENMMHSDLLAGCLGKIIDMEEEAARRINGFPRERMLTRGDVPEAARFMDVRLAGRDDGVGGRMVYCRWADPQDEELTLDEYDFGIDDVTASL